MFLLVQKEMARRGTETDCMGRKRCFSANHCFTQIVYCGECGELFRRLHWKNRGKQSIVWRCLSRLKNKESCELSQLSYSNNHNILWCCRCSIRPNFKNRLIIHCSSCIVFIPRCSVKYYCIFIFFFVINIINGK